MNAEISPQVLLKSLQEPPATEHRKLNTSQMFSAAPATGISLPISPLAQVPTPRRAL